MDDDLWLLDNVGNSDLHQHWLLSCNPQRHWLLDFDLFGYESLLNYWFLDNLLLVLNFLLCVPLPYDDFLLNNLLADLRNDWDLYSSRDFNNFLHLSLCNNDLFYSLHNIHWLLDYFGGEYWYLFFYCYVRRNLHNVVNYTFYLFKLYHLHWHLLNNLHFINVANLSNHLHQLLLYFGNFNHTGHDL